MNISHVEDYYTTADEPIGFELSSYDPYGDGTPHTHAFFEIVYMINGRANHTVLTKDKTNTNTEMRTGSIFLINMGECHYFSLSSDKNYLHRDVIIRKSIFKDVCDFLSPNLFNEITERKIPLQITVSVDKIMQFESKVKLLNQVLPSKKQQKSALLKSLLVSLLESFLSSDQEEYFSNFPAWFSELLSNFQKIDCIRGGIPYIVSCCNYDKKYLCYVFKKYTGVTMTEYLNNIRLNYAVGLLKNTGKTVSDIALDLGFSSVSYFNVIFKKRYGVSPKEMRKNRNYDILVN